MGVNKVDLKNGETLIDLQNDTVTPETLAKDVTAHNAQGEQIIGTMEQTVAKEEIEINVPTITVNGHYELTPPEGKTISKATVEVAVPTQGGGTGSGIIEVDELPTENIDENAVYRVTQKTESTLYIIQGGVTQNIIDYAASLGIAECYVYFVDELPAVLEPTTSAFHLYVVNSTGICWFNYGSYGNFTLSTIIFGDPSFDKGNTADINSEIEDGIYTVPGKNIERWYIRENGEWKIIGYDKQNKVVNLVKPGSLQVFPDDESIFSSVTINTAFKTIGDMIDGTMYSMTAITEDCFMKSDGTNVTNVRPSAFSGLSDVETAVIPSFVNEISANAFGSCQKLKEVTFKGTPTILRAGLFSSCYNLETINVPWSENDRINENKPWGAPNAKINFNYTGE
jgi:hypothetical protein